MYDYLRERRIESKEIYSGKMIHTYEDIVVLPSGEVGTREYIRHIGAVAIVPLLENGNVIIEKQFRYPIERIVREIPAGKLISKSEEHLIAAKRELQEETGFVADEWIDIGDYFPAPAYSDECVRLFIAKGLHKGIQQLDPDEFLEVEEVPLKDLVNDVLGGTIYDGKSQIAILKTAIYEHIL